MANALFLFALPACTRLKITTTLFLHFFTSVHLLLVSEDGAINSQMVERKSHKSIKLNETIQSNEIVLPAKQTKTLNYLQPVV